MQCLEWKKTFGKDEHVTIYGIGKSSKTKLKATLARTNLSLLKRAIELTSRKSPVKKIYFEGNISSYTYASEGASIYDVLNLFLDNRELIRDPAVAVMQDFEQLSQYAETAEDRELLTLIEIVKEYGKELPWHMKLLKEYHVPDEKRESAEMIFSTVHKCKGMEYDSVSLENDFVNEKTIMRYENKKDSPQFEIDKMIEEINLLYVAITRTRNKISLPADLFVNQPQLEDTKSKSAKKTGLKKTRYPQSRLKSP
jgi:superfamily I DNA/RNA helicase